MKLAIHAAPLLSVIFAPKVIASSENGGVADIEIANLDRELISKGVTSTSLSFSVASASASNDSCFDAFQYCIEEASAYAGTSAYADVEGNAFAVAYSELYLWYYATCFAYAESHAKACTFTKVDGDIKVDTNSSKGYKDVSLSVKLKTATKTIAIATSVAVADSYNGVGAYSFTNATAFCTQVNYKSPFCAGFAWTDLEQVGNASASSVGNSNAFAMSGSDTMSNILVNGRGTSLDYINGFIAAYAKSWSFANTESFASAFASAYTEASNAAFTLVCVEQHENICGEQANSGKGICNVDASEACAVAFAAGEAYASALAAACASAYAEVEAKTEVKVFVSANVDCKGRPKLTWTTSPARVKRLSLRVREPGSQHTSWCNDRNERCQRGRWCHDRN